MALFELCPFTVRPSAGVGVGGMALEVWTREKCLGTKCKLWTYKKDADGKLYEGCVFEYMGLDIDTIKENSETKYNIKMEGKEKIIEGAMICPKCKKSYDSSWKMCLQCNTALKENPKA